MNIGLVSWSSDFDNNEIFNIFSQHNYDNRLDPFCNLKNELTKNGYSINTIGKFDPLNSFESLDLVLFFKLDYLLLYRLLKSKFSGKVVYFAWEPPVVSPEHSKTGLQHLELFFDYIMTWNDDLVDNEKYFKINFPQHFSSSKDCTLISFSEKKLLTNISMDKYSTHPDELYSKRKEAIEYFEKINGQDFDFYGMRWKDGVYKNYKGSCESKIDTYSKYKFSLCFENMKNIRGYVTEKIFDCFKAGIVPIYWGASNITDYVPKECFIDYRDFNDIKALHEFLTSINEKDYDLYKGSIRNYLNSKNIDQFSEVFLRNQIIKLAGIDRDSRLISNYSIKSKVFITINYFKFRIKRLIKIVIKRI